MHDLRLFLTSESDSLRETIPTDSGVAWDHEQGQRKKHKMRARLLATAPNSAVQSPGGGDGNDWGGGVRMDMAYNEDSVRRRGGEPGPQARMKGAKRKGEGDGTGGKKRGKRRKKRKKNFCDVNSYGESDSAFEWAGVRLAGPTPPRAWGWSWGGRDERPPKRGHGSRHS